VETACGKRINGEIKSHERLKKIRGSTLEKKANEKGLEKKKGGKGRGGLWLAKESWEKI